MRKVAPLKQPVNVGDKFGRLVVVGEPFRVRGLNAVKQRQWQAVCECECGNVTCASVFRLMQNKLKSCGCLAQENRKVCNKTHGMFGTPEYSAWQGMKARCVARKGRVARAYSERGIRVCDRWVDSFENFYADMGPRPSESHSLDRIDNDRGYEPGNCRWATDIQQARNRRTVNLITVNGITKTFGEWSEVNGLHRRTMSRRKQRGWSDERVVLTPRLTGS